MPFAATMVHTIVAAKKTFSQAKKIIEKPTGGSNSLKERIPADTLL